MRRHRSLLCAIFALLLFASVPSSFAHSYQRTNDHPLRILAYPFYAVGIFLEYTVTRPIHWIVSQPNCDVIFGHQSSPDDEYWSWRVTD
jgi:hypothetical protein